MATPSNSPFEAYRANACTALEMLTASQQWREQMLTLQQHRINRDIEALRGTLEALRDAKDWNEFATGSQSVLRDYLSTSAAIWQEGVTAAMQGAGIWSDSTRDAFQKWQDSVGGLQPGAAAGAALPMREWMAAFERAVGGTVAEDTDPHGSARGRESRSRGGQHV